jgi:hypothetical protein
MKVWVAQVDCGDYYCGCGGGHIVGIYTDRRAAEGVLGGSDRPDITEVELDTTRFQSDGPGMGLKYESAWT